MLSRRPLLSCPCSPARRGWLLHELRVVAFGGVDLGPLSSRFAHDVVLAGRGAASASPAASSSRRERAAWLLIGAGVLAWTLGEIYYTAVLWDDSSPPIPRPADAGYLLFPPLALAGMLRPAAPARAARPALLVDGIAAALGGLRAERRDRLPDRARARRGRRRSRSPRASPIRSPTSSCSAVGVGALAGTGWRLDRTWVLLGAGILAFWFADSMYLVRTAEGTYESGGWFDAGWWAGLLLIAVAAWQPPPARRAVPRTTACG